MITRSSPKRPGGFELKTYKQDSIQEQDNKSNLVKSVTFIGLFV